MAARPARASASRAARPAPAVRSSRATCWPPWASPPAWPPVPSASRWGTTPPVPTSSGPWPWCPGGGRAAGTSDPVARLMRMRVLVAMSGGVDSSVAAALLVEQGHEVVGATLKLWGGPSDSGCCSVADVEDARRVAQQLGIEHHVFNLTEEFDRHVVEPYVGAHAAGRTPNPCIECNRHDEVRPPARPGRAAGFDAAGHRPPRPGAADGGGSAPRELRRGVDPAKDQSYVLSMLGQAALSRVVLPVGEMTEDDVRAQRAPARAAHGADKPDSQDVCFIGSAEGRQGFLAAGWPCTPARSSTPRANPAGTVDAVELVTVGQRRGMGHGGDGRRRYVTHVDVAARRVTVGGAEEVARTSVFLPGSSLAWVDGPLVGGARAVAQVSRARPSGAVHGRVGARRSWRRRRRVGLRMCSTRRSGPSRQVGIPSTTPRPRRRGRRPRPVHGTGRPVRLQPAPRPRPRAGRRPGERQTRAGRQRSARSPPRRPISRWRTHQHAWRTAPLPVAAVAVPRRCPTVTTAAAVGAAAAGLPSASTRGRSRAGPPSPAALDGSVGEQKWPRGCPHFSAVRSPTGRRAPRLVPNQGTRPRESSSWPIAHHRTSSGRPPNCTSRWPAPRRQ